MSLELPLLEQPEHRPALQRPGNTPASRSVYIETYGCQMNVADTELVASILNQAGFRITERAEQADVILLNTCAVRERAEERVIGRINQLNGLRAHRPHLTLGILGCMAQHLSKDLAERAPFVDLAMGPDAYRRLPQLLAQSSDEALLDVRLDRSENYAGIDPVRREGTNAWVTIIRGCDKFCTFCIVPYVRGRERSVASQEIVRQVEQLAAQGFREITLLGQTVNSYDDGRLDFAGLLRAVCGVEGIERVRFTSPYPKDFSERTIEALAELDKICPALHLPVQSGSNRQLELMRRGYTVEEYRLLTARLRASIPDLALSTDVIVGFCGETEEDFCQTLELIEEMRFDSAFTFRYSERPGTYAHRRMTDDVPEEVKGERLERVIELQERISAQINARMVGQSVEVLVEGPSRRAIDGKRNYYGRSPQGKTVIFPQEAEPNQFVHVSINSTTSHTLFGDVVAVGRPSTEGKVIART